MYANRERSGNVGTISTTTTTITVTNATELRGERREQLTGSIIIIIFSYVSYVGFPIAIHSTRSIFVIVTNNIYMYMHVQVAGMINVSC